MGKTMNGWMLTCFVLCFLRCSGSLDPHHAYHVPAGLLEDLAEGPQVLPLHGAFLLCASSRGLHHLPIYRHPQEGV